MIGWCKKCTKVTINKLSNMASCEYVKDVNKFGIISKLLHY